MVSGIHAALSGLMALQKKVESTAHNTANVDTDGYKKTVVTLAEQTPQGVTAQVSTVNTPGPMAYEPTSEGEVLVEQSNVDLAEELPNLMLSRRFFQANLKTVQAEDAMLGMLLDTKS
jgi:flagellar basal-body rod protein FlgC